MIAKPYHLTRHNVILARHNGGRPICVSCDPRSGYSSGSEAVFRGDVESFMKGARCTSCGKTLR